MIVLAILGLPVFRIKKTQQTPVFLFYFCHAFCCTYILKPYYVATIFTLDNSPLESLFKDKRIYIFLCIFFFLGLLNVFVQIQILTLYHIVCLTRQLVLVTVEKVSQTNGIGHFGCFTHAVFHHVTVPGRGFILVKTLFCLAFRYP